MNRNSRFFKKSNFFKISKTISKSKKNHEVTRTKKTLKNCKSKII